MSSTDALDYNVSDESIQQNHSVKNEENITGSLDLDGSYGETRVEMTSYLADLQTPNENIRNRNSESVPHDENMKGSQRRQSISPRDVTEII